MKKIYYDNKHLLTKKDVLLLNSFNDYRLLQYANKNKKVFEYVKKSIESKINK